MSVDADAAMGGVLRRMRVEAGYTVEGAASHLRFGSRRLLDLEDGVAVLSFTELLEVVSLYGTSASSFLLRVGAELERLAAGPKEP